MLQKGYFSYLKKNHSFFEASPFVVYFEYKIDLLVVLETFFLFPKMPFYLQLLFVHLEKPLSISTNLLNQIHLFQFSFTFLLNNIIIISNYFFISWISFIN